jgi:general stress protein 26
MKELSPEHAKEIIKSINYITIATVDEDGQPWNTPVYRSYDEGFSFYWTSWTETQHSQNIAKNPKVFLSIYDSTQAPGTGFGVYVKAKAHVVEDIDEINSALKLYYGQRNLPARQAEEFLGEYPRRLYKAVPEQFWMNDISKINGNHIDLRAKVKLL